MTGWVAGFVLFVYLRSANQIGKWLNERATRKTEALLEEMREWWWEHPTTRDAQYKAEVSRWRAEKESGRPRPFPMPRCGPPATVRM